MERRAGDLDESTPWAVSYPFGPDGGALAHAYRGHVLITDPVGETHELAEMAFATEGALAADSGSLSGRLLFGATTGSFSGHRFGDQVELVGSLGDGLWAGPVWLRLRLVGDGLLLFGGASGALEPLLIEGLLSQ